MFGLEMAGLSFRKSGEVRFGMFFKKIIENVFVCNKIQEFGSPISKKNQKGQLVNLDKRIVMQIENGSSTCHEPRKKHATLSLSTFGK